MRFSKVGLLASQAIVLTSALTASAFTSPVQATGEVEAQKITDQRPNVVFVLADDLGWGDLHSSRINEGQGTNFINTPTLDKLAAEGTVFPNAYATPTCSPTRMALMTGMYGPREENQVYQVTDLQRAPNTTFLVGPDAKESGPSDHLDDSTYTVAEMLQDADYRTGYVGKFHITNSDNAITENHGYDVNYGGKASGAAKHYHASNGVFHSSVGEELNRFAEDYTQRYVDTQLKPYRSTNPETLDALVGTDKHVMDAVGDATIEFIDDSSSRLPGVADPFFAFVGSYAVHSPVARSEGRTDLVQKYAQKSNRGQNTRTVLGREVKDQVGYASLVESLDQNVARIINELETTRDPRNPGAMLADNTIVIVTSDNGGRTDLGGNNGDLVGQKGELTEGGVRVPWFAWSGNENLVQRGKINPSVIDSTDLYPTMAAYAETPMPPQVKKDGLSLRSSLERGARVSQPRFVHLPGYLYNHGRKQKPASTIRTDRWKLYYDYESREFSLFDLAKSRVETSSRNLAASEDQVTYKLGNRLIQWFKATKPKLAYLRKNSDAFKIQMEAGTKYYRNGKVKKVNRTTWVKVGKNDEMPYVLPPKGEEPGKVRFLNRKG